MDVVCYADDTLIVANGEDWTSVKALATNEMTLLVSRIEQLGLRVALNKTEAMWFHGSRKRPPTDRSQLVVNWGPNRGRDVHEVQGSRP